MGDNLPCHVSDSCLGWCFRGQDDRFGRLYTKAGKPRLLGQIHVSRDRIEVRYIGFYRYRHRSRWQKDGIFYGRGWPWWKTLCGFPPYVWVRSFRCVVLAAGFWIGYDTVAGLQGLRCQHFRNVGAACRHCRLAWIAGAPNRSKLAPTGLAMSSAVG